MRTSVEVEPEPKRMALVAASIEAVHVQYAVESVAAVVAVVEASLPIPIFFEAL